MGIMRMFSRAVKGANAEMARRKKEECAKLETTLQRWQCLGWPCQYCGDTVDTERREEHHPYCATCVTIIDGIPKPTAKLSRQFGIEHDSDHPYGALRKVPAAFKVL
jgi:hypothetical protein